MPWMNFDLQDGKPPVGFSLKPDDCERFMEFMAECQALKETPQDAMSMAARAVLAERRRQIEVEGWTPEHDDAEHLPGEMALAACCYCVADEDEAPPAVWPWSVKWWKPKDRRRNMVRAAALLLAEIERLDRAEKG